MPSLPRWLLIEPAATVGGQPVYYVFFDFDEDVITSEAQAVIGQVARDYAAGAGDSLFVVGHTDLSGSNTYNVGLSERRSNAVLRALEIGRRPRQRGHHGVRG